MSEMLSRILNPQAETKGLITAKTPFTKEAEQKWRSAAERAKQRVQMAGGGVPTLIQIYYNRPDYPNILGEFIWKSADVAPDYPRMNAFLGFWRDCIIAPIRTVQIVHAEQPGAKWRSFDAEFKLR